LTSIATDGQAWTSPSVKDVFDNEESSVTSCESNYVHDVREETSAYYTEESDAEEDSFEQYDNKFERFFQRVKNHYKHHN
jgi:hypothetical protein